MNARHRRTLAIIYTDPVTGALGWSAIEALLAEVGCEVVEGSESRVRFVKDGTIETFHHPHPSKEAKRYQVRAARAYLTRLGVQP